MIDQARHMASWDRNVYRLVAFLLASTALNVFGYIYFVQPEVDPSPLDKIVGPIAPLILVLILAFGIRDKEKWARYLTLVVFLVQLGGISAWYFLLNINNVFIVFVGFQIALSLFGIVLWLRYPWTNK